jgi:hypothetical protein
MVACGLAMGVFVGLVVVRGTGEAEGAVTATVTPPSADDAKKATGDDKPPAAEPTPAEPSPAPSDPAPAADTSARLTFNVTPKDAMVTVDGVKVDGGKTEVKLVEGKARVRLVARADGYKSYDKSHLVTDDEAISIELVKKSHHSSSGKGPSGPGGLIDLR